MDNKPKPILDFNQPKLKQTGKSMPEPQNPQGPSKPADKTRDQEENKPVPIWEQDGGKDEFLVKGAELKCNWCQNKVKLELPVSHGEYIGKGTDHPLVNMMDCVPVQNIPSFGAACQNPAYKSLPTPPPCVPAVIPPWQNPHMDATVSGLKAITDKSFLVCALGGLIEPQNSGQPELDQKAIDEIKDWLDMYQNLPPWLQKLYRSELQKRLETLSKLLGIPKGCCMGGDPVNLATGNFIYSKVDIEIPGRFPIKFKRFYNAMNISDGVLGENWTHNFNIHLEEKDEAVHISFDDGHVETYQKLDDVYAEVNNKQLRKTADGHALTLPSKETYLFDNEGKLKSIIDQNDNRTAFEYAGDLLCRVQNPCGSLSFTYDSEQHLTQISDHCGRQVKLEYADNRLFKVTHPSGAVFRYEYNGLNLLSKVVDPMGVDTIQNVYDTQFRTVKQLFPDDGVYALDYNDAKRTTTVIDQNGNKIRHFQDAKYHTVKTVYADSEERFEYDDAGNRTVHVDRNGNIRRFTYDKWGHVTKAIDPLGYVTQFSYSGNNLLSITRENRLFSSFRYDAAGNMLETKDALDRTREVEYDHKGQPIREISPSKGVTTAKYDDRGNVTEIIDALGNTTRYEFNELNQIIKTTQPEGNSMSFYYNEAGDISEVTNAEGNTRRYFYNKNGKVTEVIDWDGSAVTYEYNSMGKITKITDPLGGVTKYEYDNMLNVIKITNANGADIIYEYDGFNRLRCAVDPEGFKTFFAYDPNGNITQITEPNGAESGFKYDRLDRKIQAIDANGEKIEYTYDAFDNLIKIRDPMGNVYKNEYDNANQLIQKTDPMGNQTKIFYNELGLVKSAINANGATEHYEYNKIGMLEKFVRPDGASECYEYDKNGRVSAFIDALDMRYMYHYDDMDRIIAIVNPLGCSKKFEYDAMDHITKKTDENGRSTQYKYDAAGNLVELIEADGSIVKYKYDFMRKLTSIEQYRMIDSELAAAQDTSEKISTRYVYNKCGLLISEIDSLGQIKRYEYDSSDRMIKCTEKDGTAVEYEYDPVGMLTKIQYADGKDVQLSYNPLRKMTEMQDWLGTTKLEMDKIGRVIETSDFENKTVKYSWSPTGEKKSITYPDSSCVLYEYDPCGRILNVNGQKERAATYSYDALGHITNRILPNGTKTEYKYNELGNIKSLVTSNSYGHIDSYEYKYDPTGNKTEVRKSRIQANGHSETVRHEYVYDEANRLASILKNDSVIRNYRYDALGNRTTMDDFENHIHSTYEYDALGRLALINSTNGDVKTFSYDIRNNLSSISQNGVLEKSFIFDETNTLTKAITADGNSATYTYDGFGRRIKSEWDIVETSGRSGKHMEKRYILDAMKPFENVLSTYGSDGECRYVWGNDLLSSVEGKTNSTYYLHDELRSPIRLLNSYGRDSAQLDYDEFGTSINKNDHLSMFGYTGYQLDPVTDLYYAQARYYMPQVGRFVSEDSFKGVTNSKATLNYFAYCNNNPLRNIDPSGSYTEEEGREAHLQIQAFFQFVHPLGEKEYNIESGIPWTKTGTGRADIVHANPTVSLTEVYEIKPLETYGPKGPYNEIGKEQLDGYVKALNGIRLNGMSQNIASPFNTPKITDFPAVKGTSFNPNGLSMPFWGDLNRTLTMYTYTSDPGMIYYKISDKPVKNPIVVPDPELAKELERFKERFKEKFTVPDPVPSNGISGADVAKGAAIAAGGAAVGFIVYEGVKWLAGVLLAPVTGGASLAVAGCMP